MSEINLLHTDSADSGINNSFAARLVARLSMVLIIAAVVIYALLYFYTWRNHNKLTVVTEQTNTLQAKALANEGRNELVTRQEQLTQLETLIDNHAYWSYLLPELARVTLRSARYTAIKASNDGKLDLIVALPSYSDVEKYLQIFDLPEYYQQFSNVRIAGITTSNNDEKIETQLNLELTFNPEFIKGKK